MTAIETTRLRLRPVQPADAALLPGLVTEKIGAMTASWPWPSPAKRQTGAWPKPSPPMSMAASSAA